MRRFWEILKILVWIIYFSPLVVGLLMIITGNGSANKDSTISTTKTNNIYTPPSNSTSTYSAPIQQTEPVRYSNGAKTPEDAYNEGYDDGYEQGKEDGRNGYSHGANYDDSSDYYDYYETKYQEGYESGYNEGFSYGNSQYEDEENDDEY